MPRRSAAVYRRRRLALLGALILVCAIIAAAIWLFSARPWANATAGAEKQTPATSATADPSADPSPSNDPSVSAEPSASETPGIAACKAPDIAVEAVTDADTYASGVMPQLSIKLTNNGAADCTIDVGSSTQAFTVSSGDDVWWRSTDCQKDPSSMIATLAAGATVESKTPVPWDRTRSSVETCDSENRPHAPGGGASYHVDVEIGGFKAAGSAQILLQ